MSLRRSFLALLLSFAPALALTRPGRISALHDGLPARGVRRAPREGLRGHRHGRDRRRAGCSEPAGYTRFRQTNEFYYLCGIETPHAYLLLDGKTKKAALFLPHRNEKRESGEGRMLSVEDADEVKKLSGVDEVFAHRPPRRAPRGQVPEDRQAASSTRRSRRPKAAR